jgi:hypothetical protein
MRSFIFTGAAILAVCFAASEVRAACFGMSNFQTCNDNAGNQYTVSRFGNMTQLNGSNAWTGSRWSETTNTIGNTTYFNGMTNGHPWNMTRQSFGGMTTYNGMNANGQLFSHTCTQYGGCQ